AWAAPRLTGAGGGSRASPSRLPDLRALDRTIALADFRGRPVVVNFWSTTCVPCRTAMPAVGACSASDPSVACVGIAHEDARPDAMRFLRATGAEYPVGFDPPG